MIGLLLSIICDLFIVVILVVITYITCLLVKTVSLIEIYVYGADKLPNQAGWVTGVVCVVVVKWQ